MTHVVFDVLFVLALVVPVLAVLVGAVVLLVPPRTTRTVTMRRMRAHA